MVNSILILQWVAFSYCMLISIFGSTANLLVLICITRSPILNAGMKVILFNAFLPSFLFSSVMMPILSSLFFPSPSSPSSSSSSSSSSLLSSSSSSMMEEEDSSFDCSGKIPVPNIFFAFLCVVTLMELLGLSLVSLYRYLAISSPGRYCDWISVLRTLLLCAFSWVLSLVIWGFIWGLRFLNFDSPHCSFEGHHVLTQSIIISVIFALPLFVTVGFMLSTQHKIREQDRKTTTIRCSTHCLHEVRVNIDGREHLHSMTPFINDKNKNKNKNKKDRSIPSNSSYRNKRSSFYKRSLDLLTRYYSLKSSPVRKEAKRFLKVTNQIWIILVVFCFTNIPHVIVHMFIHDKFAIMFIALHFLQWTHLFLDPLIYLVLNKKDLVAFFHSVRNHILKRT